MRIIANHSSWKNTPLPSQYSRLNIARTFSEQEFNLLSQGLIPEIIRGDKWFIFMKDGILYFHRSWTGICIYEVHFGNHRDIKESRVNRDPKQYKEIDNQYDESLLTSLINKYLQGQGKTYALTKNIPDLFDDYATTRIEMTNDLIEKGVPIEIATSQANKIYPSPNNPSINALLQTISQYSIEEDSISPNVFWAAWLNDGFRIFCTEEDHPGVLAERKKFQKLIIPGTRIPNGFFQVGKCDWLWSQDGKEIIGVILRTDIQTAEGNGYGKVNDSIIRDMEQNRPEDIAWAKQKINWLWEQAFHAEVKPIITLAEKWRVRGWDDYIDIYDYM